MLLMCTATVEITNRNLHLLNHSLLHPLMHSVHVRVKGQFVGSLCILLQLPRWSDALSETLFSGNIMQALNFIVSDTWTRQD